MDDKLRQSRGVKRSNTTLSGSFKMADSLLISGSGNKKALNLTVANINFIEKSEYKKQNECQVCFISFSTLTRQHHCRICANAVCSSCSISSINKQRACDVCAYEHCDANKKLTKIKILQQLKGIASLYVQNKQQIEEQLKKMNETNPSDYNIEEMKKSSQEKLQTMKQQLQNLKKEGQQINRKIEQIGSA